MAHRILIELTADDADTVTLGGLAGALRVFATRGLRVTGVEALEGEQGLVLAQHLRLALGAGGMAARLREMFRST